MPHDTTQAIDLCRLPGERSSPARPSLEHLRRSDYRGGFNVPRHTALREELPRARRPDHDLEAIKWVLGRTDGSTAPHARP